MTLNKKKRPYFYAGVDEAGAGCLAGPVISAAVMFKPEADMIEGLADSKTVSPKKREILFDVIHANAFVGVGLVEAAEIDDINILEARMKSMELAVANLSKPPTFCLVDGNRLPENLPCKAQAIVKGDQKEALISAASIIAKVTRDRLMVALSEEYPGYGFEQHMGYGTKQHLDALREQGVTKHHRKSYQPVKDILEQPNLFALT